MSSKKAILLVNVGTPDSPDVASVRHYLKSFLNDRFVIDLPWLLRKILVNLIIIPFRVRRSAGLYRKLWTKEGSPLLVNHKRAVKKLGNISDDSYIVRGAMRYGNPSIDKVFDELEESGINEIIVLPLYPHYSYSTTETLKEFLRERYLRYKISFVDQFYSHPAYIDSFANKISGYNPANYDHIIFSYHGLPIRHIQRMHPGFPVSDCGCDKQMPVNREKCYRAACYETTRLLAVALNLPEETYSTSFQSRLSKNWLKPFTDEKIRDLKAEGINSILVAAPSFVADCLETKIEIGVEYRDMFLSLGGKKLDLVESLNNDDRWISAMIKIIEEAKPLD